MDARELADLISSTEAVPASGWVAGITAAFSAALVAKVASRSDGWSGAAGAQAQAADLRDRLLELSAKDAQAYESALDALERRDAGLAQALGAAAEVPLALAEAAADVALLAASAAECADGAARADAAAAAALAAGAARAASKLVAVNLATSPGDDQVAAAARAVEAAEDAARAALASEI
ncbi:MAG: cyclodeaminase/cyclohydrolase family protein [Gaiellaceae bacterium]